MPIDIQPLLEAGSVTSHFQPILSVTGRKVVALEALARAQDPLSGKALSPAEIFPAALAQGRHLELERLCRVRALEAFSRHYLPQPGLTLFLNFDVSTLDLGVEGSGHLINLVEQMGIPPGRVMIEVVESKVRDTQALQRFVRRHRKAGFMLALDDIGAGHSNLDRVALLQPDLLKLDASLVRGVERSFHQQEVIKALVGLAHRTGAQVLAEGVESATEALACLELGASLIQGFHFAKPLAPAALDLAKLEAPAQRLAEAHRRTKVAQLKARRELHQRFNAAFSQALVRLAGEPAGSLQPLLDSMVSLVPGVEQLLLLDERGCELASAQGLCGMRPSGLREEPHGPGTDHSMREVYYLTYEAGLRRFTTETYLSPRTGAPCLTLAGWLKGPPGQGEMLLCMDLNPGAEA